VPSFATAEGANNLQLNMQSVTVADLAYLKEVQLRAALSARGLAVDGDKPELVCFRCRQALTAPPPNQTQRSTTASLLISFARIAARPADESSPERRQQCRCS